MLLKLQYELGLKLKELRYEFKINYNTEYDINNYINIKISTYGGKFSNKLIYSSSIQYEDKQLHIFENLAYSESFKSINEVITYILSKLK